MPARSDRISSSAESGCFSLMRHLLRPGDLDALDRDQVALDVGAGSVRARSRLDFTAAASSGVPSWKVDAAADVEQQGLGIGIAPGFGEAGQRLQRCRLEIDQRVVDRIEEGMIRARAAGLRIEARRVGVGRYLQHAALLGPPARGPCRQGRGPRRWRENHDDGTSTFATPMTSARHRRSAACPGDWAGSP